jgi:hypothetical protein
LKSINPSSLDSAAALAADACGMEEHAVEGYKRINDTRTDQLLAPAPEMIVYQLPVLPDHDFRWC